MSKKEQTTNAFDPANMAKAFADLAETYKIPGCNPEALLESHRKNVEALSNANQVLAEGMKAIAGEQADFLRRSVEDASSALQSMTQTKDIQDAAGKQTQFIQNSFDASLENAQRIFETGRTAKEKASEVIGARISEGLKEATDQAPGAKG
jgi:phasin family protein